MSKSALPTLLIKGKLKNPTPSYNGPSLKDEIPIQYILNWFRIRLNRTGLSERVLILKSETASGKSTLFPPELYKAFIKGSKDGRGIICTQPRVITAIENVNEMLKHYSNVFKLGTNIGWSTKHNKFQSSKLGLLSSTVGTLTQQLKTMTDEEIMNKYKFILIDETHERDLPTDLCIYLLANFVKRNADNSKCPFIVLMSATFETEEYTTFFGLNPNNNVIWCVGETAGFDEIYLPNSPHNDYTLDALNAVKKIHEDNYNDDPSKADVLIFMPGSSEIIKTSKRLQAYNKELYTNNKKVLSILKIDGPAVKTKNADFIKTIYMPVTDYNTQIILDNNELVHVKASRKVILTTNVAETGLTLDNLKYVIDAGYNREIEYNPIYNISCLLTKPAPQSRIRQRKGRAGRKFRGVFYPLYSKETYDYLPKNQLAQIVTNDFSPIFMDIFAIQMKLGNTSFNPNVNMLTDPPPDSVLNCIEKHYNLGIINDKMELTELGKLIGTKISLPIEQIRMILAGYSWNCCILDLITIVAYIQNEQNNYKYIKLKHINWPDIYKEGLSFNLSDGSTRDCKKMKLLIADEFIEGIILFNAFKYLIKRESLSDLAKVYDKFDWDFNINHREMLYFVKARDDIIEMFIEAGFDVTTNEDNSLFNTSPDELTTTITRMKYCIFEGYRNNIIYKKEKSWQTRNGLEIVVPNIFVGLVSKTYRKGAGEEDDELIYGGSHGKSHDKPEEVIPPSWSDKFAPSYVICKEISLAYDKDQSIYNPVAKMLSIMDGYVSVDEYFSL